jgi:hypothetical protein
MGQFRAIFNSTHIIDAKANRERFTGIVLVALAD